MKKSLENKKTSSKQADIAIIGINGRFPMSSSIEEYWQNLCLGKELITYFSEEELVNAGISEKTLADPNYIRASPILENYDKFDAEFFGFTPKHAIALDPQFRILLECAWEIFEQAGYSIGSEKRNVGVFTGSGSSISSYFLEYIKDHPEAIGTTGSLDHIGSDKDYLATLLSYKLNFSGPSINIQTACSTSLVALHLACQSLRNKECEMALAGGVNVRVPHIAGYRYETDLIYSNDGHCRPFDANASGVVFGSAGGLVLLKPLEEAIIDQDEIYAVIKGTAINNDAGSKMSYTVSSTEGQDRCFLLAFENAGLSAETIDYVETHGTGTKMGDPIEINALAKTFRKFTSKKEFCNIGSVKANIGHVDSAAGIAGLIKAILILKYKLIPPQINFKESNPKIDFKNSPFKIATQLTNLDTKKKIHRAAVNALGIGGTNAFVILEGYSEKPKKLKETQKPYYLVTLSAKKQESLMERVKDLRNWLINSDHQKNSIEAVSYTLNCSRNHFSKRIAIITNSIPALIESLNNVIQNKPDIDVALKTEVKGPIFREEEINKSLNALGDLINSNSKEYQDQLRYLANAYVQGSQLNWEELHSKEQHEKLVLPTYPFNRKRYWTSSKTVQMEEVALEAETKPKKQPIMATLIDIFSEATQVPRDQIQTSTHFNEYGIDSMMIISMNNKLVEIFKDVPSTLFFTYHNLDSIERFLNARVKKDYVEAASEKKALSNRLYSENDIAIIGFTARYPMSETVEQYWKNLKEARDCTTEIPRDRWDYRPYYTKEKGSPGKIYCKRGGFINDVAAFDHRLFNISPKEAAMMTPQERLCLQAAWSCFESAGYAKSGLLASVGKDLPNRVGVYIGYSYNDYQQYGIEAWQTESETMLISQTYMAANRISYFFDLTGPSVSLDTACSSSLFAIHMACEALRRKECGMALIGSVNLHLHPSKFTLLCGFGMLSTDGRCHSFTEGGDGFGTGEGVDAILLKPLSSAIRDGDPIHGVIRGGAVSQDGKTNAFFVPNPLAQAQAIEGALKMAEVNPESVNFFEAHGTGTSLGDPIEISGITEAFSKQTSEKQFCPISSAKAIIGHTEACAGIAGVIKILMQMKYKKLVPAFVDSDKLNPNIDFKNSPCYVQTQLEDWLPRNEQIRRACINSFGAGGVNAHVIIDEYISDKPNKSTSDDPSVIVLSAKTKEQLLAYAQNLLNYFQHEEEERYLGKIKMADIAYTLQIGREAMNTRVAFLAANISELQRKLGNFCDIAFDQPMLEKQGFFYNEIPVDRKNFGRSSEILDTHNLKGIAEKWVAGERIEWQSLYKKDTPDRIYLPTYPFEKAISWYQSKQKVGAEALELASINTDDWIYEYKWKLDDIHDVKPVSNFKGRWIVFANHEKITEKFKAAIPENNRILCYVGSNFSETSSHEFTVDPNSADSFMQLLASITKEDSELSGIIYCWSVGAADMSTSINRDAVGLLHLFKSMANIQWKNPIPFWLITDFSQPVLPTDKINIFQHYLWAYCRVFSQEQSEFFGGMIDTDEDTNVDSLLQVIINPIPEDHIAFRNNQRYLLRFQRCEDLKKAEIMGWDKSQCVLITGGLGALGRVTANWLIQKGVKKLILIGRTPLPPKGEWVNLTEKDALFEKMNSIKEMEAQGVKVHYICEDIANRKALENALETAKNEGFSPITGVFHLSGITTDAIPFKDMEKDLLLEVLKTKVYGSWIIHELLIEEPLQFFILYSSISAIPGFSLIGLSAYAAANGFMDGLAHYRRLSNLPAMSLNWTGWDDVGMSFEYSHHNYFEAIGMKPLKSNLGLKIIDELVDQINTQLAIVNADWAKLAESNYSIGQSNIFSTFLGKAPVTTLAVKKKSVVDEATLETFILEQIAETLGIDRDQISRNEPFQNFGLDSVSGLLLIKKISDYLQRPLNPTLLFRHTSLKKLAMFLSKQEK